MKKASTIAIAIMLVLLVYVSPLEGQVIFDKPIARLGMGIIGDIAFSPDGNLLALATNLGVCLLDGNDLAPLGFMNGYAGSIYSVAFSPDGKLIASGGSDRNVRLWDVAARRKITDLEGHTGNVTSVAFSPDGQVLASTGGSYFTPERETVIDGTIRLWDVAVRKEIAVLESHDSGISCVAFSPGGKLLASGGGDGVCLWDFESRTLIGSLAPDEYTSSVAFSPDGNLLASGGWCMVRLWNIERKEEIYGDLLEPSPLGGATSIAFSPDGETFAVSVYISGPMGIGGGGYIVHYDVIAEGSIQKRMPEFWPGAVHSLAYSPDGSKLASVEGLWGGTQIVLAGKKTIAANSPYENVSIAFSPDGKTLASASGKRWDFSSFGLIQLWDITERKEVAVFRGSGDGSIGYSKVAFSPDGNMLASLTFDCCGNNLGFCLWDIAANKEIKEIATVGEHTEGWLMSHTGSVSFSPDGKTIASGNVDGAIRLWDVAEKKEIAVLEGHTDVVNSVAFSPDGKILASASGNWYSEEGDNTVRLWDVVEKKEIAVLEGHTDGVNSVAFSPDGNMLASASGSWYSEESDNTVRLWDVVEKKEIAVLEGHTDVVNSVAFNPNGQILVSGSSDKTVRLWDVAERKEIAVLEGHNGTVNSVVFSPDGQMLASASSDCTILLWGEMPTTSVEPMGKVPFTWGRLKPVYAQRAVRRTKLLQNYPNPFNPETWIPFELAQESEVSLRIYDAKGSLIREISLGRKQSGPYIQRSKAIHWDGRNDSGERAASGVYFYTLQAGDYSKTRKMILAE